jgi:CRP/FNR family cyclic AMP-dependent transcriptional regulator
MSGAVLLCTGAGRRTCHARDMIFDLQAFLTGSGAAKSIGEYVRNETIFTPGDPCEAVLYIQRGGVKLSVRSKTGEEGLVATLGPGEFFGEACLAGQPFRVSSATAITPSSILIIAKEMMARLLRQERGMADRFISHMLSRNIRIEEDLIDRLIDPR